jgi:hypothetical protein
MHMTIKIRERLFSVFFASSLFLFGGAIAVVWFLGLDGLYQVLPGWKVEASTAVFYTVLGSAGVSGLFSVVVTGLVTFRSGKTVSVEIFFFTLWAFCQVFELTKIGSLLLGSRFSNLLAYELITRQALFGRYCAVIAIFAGSLFSTGLKQERGIPVFMATLMVSLFFSSVHPLNSARPGIDLLADRGVSWLAFAFEVLMIVLALLNYLMAWRNTRERENLVAAMCVSVCFSASTMIKGAQSPLVAILAFAGLCAGTWIYMRTMHKYYLWR